MAFHSTLKSALVRECHQVYSIRNEEYTLNSLPVNDFVGLLADTGAGVLAAADTEESVLPVLCEALKEDF